MATSKAVKNPIVVRQAKNKKTGLPNGKFYYNTVGRNGETMNSSELYPNRSNAERGKSDNIAAIERYLVESGRVTPSAMNQKVRGSDWYKDYVRRQNTWDAFATSIGTLVSDTSSMSKIIKSPTATIPRNRRKK